MGIRHRHHGTAIAVAALAAVLLVFAVLAARAEPAGAAFPGRNGKIAFGLYNKSYSGILLVDPNGSNPIRLTGGADPAFSPDGARVAFTERPRGDRDSEIYTINTRSRKVTRITANDFSESAPAWSPDGRRLVFERDLDTGRFTRDVDLVIKNASGVGATTNETNTPGVDEYDPAWSPSGQEIAFTQSDTGDIHALNPATDARRNISNDGMTNTDSSPNWSPDGRRIAYESCPGNIDDCGEPSFPDLPGDYYEIYTMNALDGSDRKRVYSGFPFGEGDGSEFMNGTDWGDIVRH